MDNPHPDRRSHPDARRHRSSHIPAVDAEGFRLGWFRHALTDEFFRDIYGISKAQLDADGWELAQLVAQYHDWVVRGVDAGEGDEAEVLEVKRVAGRLKAKLEKMRKVGARMREGWG